MPLDGDPFRGPIPKDGKRKVDRMASKRTLSANRTCVICGDPAGEAHHVLPRSAGGDDVPENLVGLDSDCHGDVEARRGTARKELGAYIVRNRPDTLAYVREKLDPGGDAYLKRHYFIKGGPRARQPKAANPAK